jgi:hypothetical protein
MLVHGLNARAQGVIEEIGAEGGPDARQEIPTGPVGSLLGRSPRPHGGPSPSSSAPRHYHPLSAIGLPGLGAARDRTIRSKIAANDPRGTGTLDIWSVRVLERDTTLAPILTRFSRSVEGFFHPESKAPDGDFYGREERPNP